MARANKLFAGDGVHEFEEAAVEIWVTLFAQRVRGQGIACQLALQDLQGGNVLLKRWQGAEEVEPGFVALQGDAIAFDESRVEPGGRALVFRDADESGREESACGVKEQAKPGFSLVERPDFQLMRE